MGFPAIVTEAVELSGGRTATIRRLGWKAKKAARDAKQREALDLQKQMGVAFQQELRESLEKAGGIEKLRETAAANPHLQFDWATVLEKGVVSLSGIDGTPTAAVLDELEEADAEALVKRIVALSPEKTEAERKNS
jgi:hypothetical protein